MHDDVDIVEQCGHEWPTEVGTHSCALRGGHARHVPHLCWCAELSEEQQR